MIFFVYKKCSIFYSARLNQFIISKSHFLSIRVIANIILGIVSEIKMPWRNKMILDNLLEQSGLGGQEGIRESVNEIGIVKMRVCESWS